MKDLHSNVQSGLVINPSYPYLGASPDGVIAMKLDYSKLIVHISTATGHPQLMAVNLIV